MPTSPSKRKEQDLLARMQQASTHTPPVPSTQASSQEASPPLPAVPAAEAGQVYSFYLHPPEQKMLRELHAWFAAQGVRINDSLVIKSLLHVYAAHHIPGSELLAAYHQALQSDRRLKKRKTP